MKLKVELDRLTLDDIIAIQNNELSARDVRDLLAKFAADDNGDYLPEDEAIKAVGKLTLSDLSDVVADLAQQIEAVLGRAVSPPNASA